MVITQPTCDDRVVVIDGLLVVVNLHPYGYLVVACGRLVGLNTFHPVWDVNAVEAVLLSVEEPNDTLADLDFIDTGFSTSSTIVLIDDSICVTNQAPNTTTTKKCQCEFISFFFFLLYVLDTFSLQHKMLLLN